MTDDELRRKNARLGGKINATRSSGTLRRKLRRQRARPLRGQIVCR